MCASRPLRRGKMNTAHADQRAHTTGRLYRPPSNQKPNAASVLNRQQGNGHWDGVCFRCCISAKQCTSPSRCVTIGDLVARTTGAWPGVRGMLGPAPTTKRVGRGGLDSAMGGQRASAGAAGSHNVPWPSVAAAQLHFHARAGPNEGNTQRAWLLMLPLNQPSIKLSLTSA
jgi:hypothetical protein